MIKITCLQEVLGEYDCMEDAWNAEPSSACRVINFVTGEVFTPVIVENTWYGEFKIASPETTKILLEEFKNK